MNDNQSCEIKSKLKCFNILLLFIIVKNITIPNYSDYINATSKYKYNNI